MDSPRSLIVFLIVSFTTAYIIDFTLVVPDPSSVWAFAGLVLRMFTPLLGVVAALYLTGYSVRRGLWELGVRVGRVGYILVAVAVPYMAMAVAVPLSLAFGVRILSAEELLETILEAKGIQGVEIPGFITLLVVVNMLAVNALAGATINAVPALAEEIGWRGLLLVGLQDRLGFIPASIVSGIIWGLWHAPIIYMIGYNYPGYHGVIPLAAFTVFTVAVGLAYSLLRALSYSLIPPAIAHGVLNANGGLLILLFQGDRLVAPPAGIAHAAGYAIVVLLLLEYARRRGLPLYARRDYEPEQPTIY